MTGLGGLLVATLAAPHRPRRPEDTVLHRVVRQHLETFIACRVRSASVHHARALLLADVKLDLPEAFAVADPSRAHAAFRCVQEAVTNVLKHADASTIRIVAKHDVGKLEIRVEDNGVGTGSVVPGGGLRGMRERVGGTLEIIGTEGGGTTVLAHFPLREPT